MIAILLSAYNGADYIGKQIDSLLSQTYQDFTIYIRDDGSNDGTIGIIDSFVNKFPDKVKHVDRNGDNLGVGQSFMWLWSMRWQIIICIVIKMMCGYQKRWS